ncbi:aminodeoxychorismate lyase [Moraxella macacae 0408225]|uniref:Endolytic murein transglycosylase n=1 Tax=Moraxella macacae 0408225 TaxID=1230338 RepID=L2F8B1_9GAMM|nr:endolytic transglycosylase MltG [Moraxella macacae]ELA09006.1 aminodeoxychorismate lyase [Moraxella macacae 0408225]
MNENNQPKDHQPENNQPHQQAQSILVAKPKKSAKGWVVLLVLIVVWLFFWAIYQTAFRPISQKKQMITIEQGETYNGLIDKWQDKNQGMFIKPLAKLYVKIHAKKPLHAGMYQLPDNPSFAQMLSILQQGSKAALVKIQIIEGKTAADLYNMLRGHEGIKNEILSGNALTPQELRVNLPKKYAPNGNMEGWFAPDTYYFAEGSSDKQVLASLFNRQYTMLIKAWEKRQSNLPYATPYEALIMASIIEKETSLASERSQIAGVFVNRLRQKMRLQTDPTVIYGMGDRYDGNIKKSDLQQKTAYNTYQIDGLPPTPIALPSLASIEAALNPDKTDALYFVATGYGGHKFSTNLADHNKAVQAYLKVMRSKQDHHNQPSQLAQ